MNVLIVGGTGLLGSHVAVQLLQQGHRVTLFSRNVDAVPAFKTMPGVTLRQGNYYDEETLKKVLPGHDACVTTVLSWGNTARTMLDNDLRPSVMLMELAADAGVKSFVYTSSTGALGEYRQEMHEEMMTHPIPGWDLYCATKRASELFLQGISFHSPMRCNIIRPGSFFGVPAVEGGRVHTDDIFQRVARQVCANEPVEVMDCMGNQCLGVNHLARIFVAVLNGSMNREIYFACSKPWYSEESIAKEAIAIAGSKSNVVLKPNPEPGKPRCYTVEKIKQHFGFEFDSWPQIQETLKYWTKHFHTHGAGA